MLKLLKRLIFAKDEPKQEQKWTIQNNGWEANAKRFDDYQKTMRGY